MSTISIYSKRATDLLKFASNKGLFDVLISNLLIGVVGFGGQFFVAWLLEPEDLGRIKIFQSYIEIAALFAVFGFDTSIVKICSEEKYQINIKYIVGRTIKIVLLIALVTYLIFILFNSLNLFGSDDNLKRSFYLYSGVFIFMGLNKVLFGYLQSQKLFRIYSKLQVFSKLLALLLIVVLTYFFYLDGFYLGMLIGFAFTTFLLLRVVYSKLKQTKLIKVKSVFNYQWFLARNSFYSNISGSVSTLIGVFLLNYLITDMREIGYYSFALVIGLGLSMITASVQKIIFPYLSNKAVNISIFLNYVKKYSRLLIIVSVLISILCFLTIPPFLDYLFSNKYSASNKYIILVVFNWLLINTYAIKGIGLTALGEVKANAVISIMRMVLNTILSYILIVKLGVQGAIIALLVTNIMTTIVYSNYYKKVKINAK